MYHIPQNLAPNVNLSYCMDLWTLGSKLQKKVVIYKSKNNQFLLLLSVLRAPNEFNCSNWWI